MRIRVQGLRLGLDYTENDLIAAAADRLAINPEEITECKLTRRSVDARRKKVYFTCTVDLNVESKDNLRSALFLSPEITEIEPIAETVPMPGGQAMAHPPVIIGSGPAGLFCALYLAQNGYRPVLFEQGPEIERRIREVEQFWKTGKLNPRANTQFGEGGAGTFSDGKLTTRSKDPRIGYVLDTFIRHGADEEIRYIKKPHVGTDVIRRIIKNMRQEILELGGEIYFDSCLTDIAVNKNLVENILINKSVNITCTLLVLAVGNSARDIYRILYARGIEIIPKAFAMGLRIEHPQGLIDRVQYGNYAGHPRLGAADYHLTYQDKATGRALYTFCMCPGGYVIAAASDREQVVTNGMSYFARDTGVANAALVVTVNPSDWGNQPLGGMKLQQQMEKRAYELGGHNYNAPAQKVNDFMNKKTGVSLEGSIATYTPGLTAANMWNLLSDDICMVLLQGLSQWNKKIPGYIHEQAVLTGVETRTSAPVRISRTKDMCSVNMDNLYPCGEGAGYAGGIMSSAVDGLKTAERIIARYQRPAGYIDIKDGLLTNARSLGEKQGVD